MNNITCQVIMDLLPLYGENIVSEESRALVESHLKECPSCRETLSKMMEETSLPKDNDAVPLLAIKKKLFHRKLATVAFTLVLVITLAILSIIHVTAPIPIEYSEDLLTINELENGALLVTTKSGVTGYDHYLSRYEDSEKGEVHLTLWTTLWNKYFPDNKEKYFIINKTSTGQYTKLDRVFYYSIDDNGNSQGDIIIYGSNISGGVLTLPRLALSYYFSLALILMVIFSILWLLLRSRKNLGNILRYITLIPLAYVLGQLCVMGLDFSTYTLVKDFTSILLVMIPIYLLLAISPKVIRELKKIKK